MRSIGGAECPIVETEQRHWTHLLAVALHRLEEEQEPPGADLTEFEDYDTPVSPGDIREEEDIAVLAAARFGCGPLPVGFGLQERHLRLRPARLLLLLRLCRAIGTVERLETMLRQGALTVVQGRADLRDLEWVLQEALVPDRQVVLDGPSGDPHSLHLGSIERLGEEHNRYTRSDPCRILEATAPIVLLQAPGHRLPPRVEIFAPPVLELGALDGECMQAMLELCYPELTAEEVLRLGPVLAGIDLSSVEEEAVLGLFRLPSAADVLAALRRSSEAETGAGIALRNLVGLGAAQEAAVQILEDLALWRRGELAWKEVCRGLLLVGPPGTGKTLLARAMAQEAGLTFVSCSYAQWQKLGNLSHFLKGMADDFGKAIGGRPALLFIDEIDAFYTRQELEGGRNDSYDIKAIAGLLEHLDGFAGREGVVLLAATNHLEQVDPAITRAGRFDRIVSIGLPNQTALQVILRQHLGGALPAADLFSLAGLALGKTGADIAAAVRMAGAAARRDRRAMGEADMVAALLGEAGPERPKAFWRRVAIHEAGHAVLARATGAGRPASIRLGAHGGETMTVMEPGLETAETLHRERMVQMAGRAAERIMFGVISGGAGGPQGSDLAKVTLSVIEQELRSGLGHSGPIWCPPGPGQTDILTLPPQIRRRVEAQIRRAERDATRVLKQNRSILEMIAEVLTEKRFLSGNQLDALLQGVVPA